METLNQRGNGLTEDSNDHVLFLHHPLPPEKDLLAIIRLNLAKNIAVVVRGDGPRSNTMLPIDGEFLEHFDIDETRQCESHSLFSTPLSSID